MILLINCGRKGVAEVWLRVCKLLQFRETHIRRAVIQAWRANMPEGSLSSPPSLISEHLVNVIDL